MNSIARPFSVIVVAVLMAALAAALGASIALARNPDFTSSSYGGCEYQGYSEEFGDSQAIDDFSQTGQTPYAYCPDLMQVYAYFWGAEGAWHWMTSPWVSGHSYAAVNTPSWGYWTNQVYGYHQIQEPTGSYSPQLTTDAF